MKNFATAAVLMLLVLFTDESCSKTNSTPSYGSPRKIKYVLYTNTDFSGNSDTIKFSLVMRTQNKELFDSALAPMLIKDIPHADHKIVIEKNVPGNDSSDLSVGFLYTIVGVGNSWYLDTCKAGNAFKVVEYDFR